MKKIVVDLLGSDNPPALLLKGALEAAAETNDFITVLVGNSDEIEAAVKSSGIDRKKIEIADARDYIKNTEAPTAVLHGRENASLSVCYRILSEDPDAEALVSAGSTGAVLVGSIYKLGLIENVHRPALASAFPTDNGGQVCLLDCGANVDVKKGMLVELAHLGSAFCSALLGKERPSVSLLSVGTEDKKGTLFTKDAFEQLKNSRLNFVGNVEGYDILTGKTDVIVCDGYVGNVVIKLCEYMGKATALRAKQLLREHGFEGTDALMHDLYREYDYNNRGGAIMLGAKKVVIKAHGAATDETILCCYRMAAQLAKNDLVNRTAKIFSEFGA